jgi:hypothetical protein
MPGFPRKPNPKLTDMVGSGHRERYLAHQEQFRGWIPEAVAMYEATMMAMQDNTIEAMLHHLPSAQLPVKRLQK